MTIIKCPDCGKKINQLLNIEAGFMRYSFCLDLQGNTMYRACNFLSNDSFNEYHCPVCGAVLFDNEDEAIVFLTKK